jgi:hypothetical protein
MKGICATALCVLCLWIASADAQQPIGARQPESIGENLLRLEGTDPVSGIRYQKLILLLKSQDAPADTDPGSLPRFTMECREQAGRRTLHWLVRFDGSPDFDFQRPRIFSANDPNSLPNPNTNLKMRFEGYIRSEEFKRQWEILPTGELHYRNPGLDSSNLDDPRHFLAWLTSLPDLRIGYAKPVTGQVRELIFPTKPLLDAMKKSNFCEP